MLYLLTLLVHLCSTTSEDCMRCSWPFTSGGVNSSGKCIPSLNGSYQTGLSGFCYAYCNGWSLQGDTSQGSTYPVQTFIDAGTGVLPTCICQRLHTGRYIETKVYASNSCDYGMSDANVTWGDTSSFNTRQTNVENEIIKITSASTHVDTVRQILHYIESAKKGAINYIASLAGGADYEAHTEVYCTNNTIDVWGFGEKKDYGTTVQGQWGTYTGTGINDGNNNYNFSMYGQNQGPGTTVKWNDPLKASMLDWTLPSGVTCDDITDNGLGQEIKNQAKNNLDQLANIDTALQRLSAALTGDGQGTGAKMNGIQDAIHAMDSSIKYKLNSGVGAGAVDVPALARALDSIENSSTCDTCNGTDSNGVVGAVNRVRLAVENQTNLDTSYTKNLSRVGDSVFRANGLDTVGLMMSGNGGLDSITALGQSNATFAAANSGLSSDSIGMLAIIPGSTCTDFPDDPYIDLPSYLQADGSHRLVFPMSQHRTILLMLKAGIDLLAAIATFIIVINGANIAVYIVTWQVSKGKH